MAIGNDDLDYLDDFDTSQPDEQPQAVDNEIKQEDDDFVTSLLKSRGIEDKSKIKFEDEQGTIEELNWDNLSNDEKLNVLNSSNQDPETDLDDNEIQLINAIRGSGLTPAQYLETVQRQSINNYLQNSRNTQSQYQVDQYSDDELFIYDFISRMGDVTNEEAQEALEKAKSNETLFNKQMNAIRNEYKSIEEENKRQAEIEQEEMAKEQFNQFAGKIADQISNFNEFQGYDLNLDSDDKDTLYEFITGRDAAGYNHFYKALSDPKTLVETAWLILNGRQMVDDITSYFQNEIKKVRRENTQKQDKNSNVVFTDKKIDTAKEVYNDLDEF